MVGRSDDHDEGFGFRRLKVWCGEVLVVVVVEGVDWIEMERSRRALAARSHGIQAMSSKVGIVLGRMCR